MLKREFVFQKASFVRAQHSLESAYAALKKFTVDAPGKSAIANIQGNIVQARRRVRREYQRACREYDAKQNRRNRKELLEC